MIMNKHHFAISMLFVIFTTKLRILITLINIHNFYFLLVYRFISYQFSYSYIRLARFDFGIKNFFFVDNKVIGLRRLRYRAR